MSRASPPTTTTAAACVQGDPFQVCECNNCKVKVDDFLLDQVVGGHSHTTAVPYGLNKSICIQGCGEGGGGD